MHLRNATLDFKQPLLYCNSSPGKWLSVIKLVNNWTSINSVIQATGIFLSMITCVLNRSSFRLLHFSQSTTVWDDLIENLWRHVVAVGVVLVAVIVGFSRLVYSACLGVKKTNFGGGSSYRLQLWFKNFFIKKLHLTTIWWGYQW